MPIVEVQFHGLWGLYLGTAKMRLECDTVDELLALVESRFGDSLRQNIRERGAKLEGEIIKYSYMALNEAGLKQLPNRQLKSGDVLHIFPAISGG
jgi:molybdopterin converting factor small subunit